MKCTYKVPHSLCNLVNIFNFSIFCLTFQCANCAKDKRVYDCDIRKKKLGENEGFFECITGEIFTFFSFRGNPCRKLGELSHRYILNKTLDGATLIYSFPSLGGGGLMYNYASSLLKTAVSRQRTTGLAVEVEIILIITMTSRLTEEKK